MNIYIDADGCPVVKETINVAKQFEIPVIIICDAAHYFMHEGVQTITVMPGSDAVDYEIINRLQPGDLVITQDYGLASLVLPKGVSVLHQLGYQYTKENIDGLLEQRYFSGQIRRKGGRTKGPKPFTDKDRTTFKQALIELVERSL